MKKFSGLMTKISGVMYSQDVLLSLLVTLWSHNFPNSFPGLFLCRITRKQILKII
jgi:hypothetical protein